MNRTVESKLSFEGFENEEVFFVFVIGRTQYLIGKAPCCLQSVAMARPESVAIPIKYCVILISAAIALGAGRSEGYKR